MVRWSRWFPAFVAAGYVLVGAFWIVGSDALVAAIFADYESLLAAQTVKGWAYVAATGVILYVVLRAGVTRITGAEQIATAVTSNFPGVIFQCQGLADGNIRYTYLSPNAEAVLTIAPARLLADPSVYLNLVHPDDRAFFKAQCSARASDGDTTDIEYRLLLPDGTQQWMWTRALASVGSDGGARWNGIIIDVTDRKEAEARLDHLAHHDALTDLPNRVLFEDRLAQAIPAVRRGEKALAVAVVDLDRFRSVNETFGLAGGDTVLRQVARRLTAAVRPGDTVARLSGDRFAIMLANLARRNDTVIPIQRLRRALMQPLDINDQTFVASGTFGVSIWPEDGDDSEHLLRHAEAAILAGKLIGGDQIHFFSPTIGEALRTRTLLEGELRRAIEAGSFTVHYQPIVDATSFRVVAVEALLRWDHPVRGRISPADFIPLAEETGLIVEIGLWTLRTACQERARWSAAGFDLDLSVNLSARQVRDDDLEQQILRIVAETAMDPTRLQLELTESALFGQRERILHLMTYLSGHGIRFAIDDFGVGYSSFAYLHTLPVDTIKIDLSFIAAMTRDHASAAVVQAITSMGHTLGKKMVAEGVEDQAQVTYLRAYRCDELQGFLFGRPMGSDELLRHLADTAKTTDDSKNR